MRCCWKQLDLAPAAQTRGLLLRLYFGHLLRSTDPLEPANLYVSTDGIALEMGEAPAGHR